MFADQLFADQKFKDQQCTDQQFIDATLITPDGVNLVARIWTPQGAGPWPTLLMRQPYGRAIASTVTLPHPLWWTDQGFAVKDSAKKLSTPPRPLRGSASGPNATDASACTGCPIKG
jgi:hypothetical protein